MNSAALLSEVQQLRRDLAALSARVLALENQGEQASSVGPVFGSPVTVNYSYPVGSGSIDIPPFPLTGAGSSEELPTATSVPETVAGAPPQSLPVTPALPAFIPEADRRAVAVEIGLFLRRSLDGVHRGTSGRSRLGLPSRCYILVRDLSGNLYNPVRIFNSFGAIKSLVKDQGDCKNSIFVGLPTKWEAKLAVETAGLQWPADGS